MRVFDWDVFVIGVCCCVGCFFVCVMICLHVVGYDTFVICVFRMYVVDVWWLVIYVLLSAFVM